MKSNRNDSSAFTRTDLLVVLATVALLAVVITPLLGASREQSRAGVCLANLKRLTLGWTMYAADNDGWLPPTPDDGNTTPGRNWVAGQAGMGGAEEFNTAILADRSRSMIYPYLENDVSVFRCPADPRRGLFRPSGLPPVPNSPAARSVAANAAVGVNPNSTGAKVPTEGPWLDSNHTHAYGRKWFTYGRLDQIVAPSPAGLWMLIDEAEASINEGTLAFGMEREEWIDWPGSRHDLGTTISFADGHAELHHWQDSRTILPSFSVTRLSVPGSVDYAWLRERTSAPIP